MSLTEIPPRSDPESASERAYRYVKDAVLRRAYLPNALITEGEIADAVKVSRTPVREALLRLQGEGLLRLLPKRGALVLGVTAAEVADLMETRRLIEVFAIRKVIGAGSVRPLLARLDRHLAAMRDALQRRDTTGYVEADRAFHTEIVAATNNAILTTLYRLLRDRQLLIGVVNLLDDSGAVADQGRMRTTLHEHEAIRSAIEARTIRAAESAVAVHLEHAEHRLGRRS